MSPSSVDDAPSYAGVETHADLIAYTRAYARDVVAATDLDVDLDRVAEWSVSTGAKRRAGAVRHVRVPDADVGTPLDWNAAADAHADLLARSRFDRLRDCEIRLSWRAFAAFDEAEWGRTVRHELVHVEQFQRFGRTTHGPAFRERCAELGTTRHCPTFHTGRYLVECRHCGDVRFDRVRECKTTRLAALPVDEQQSRVRPTDCCGAYYRLVDAESDAA